MIRLKFRFYWIINFTADTSFTIESAWVDADGAGNRTFYLWEGNVANGANQPTNNLINQITVPIADGAQRIDLNLDIPSAGDYAIGGNEMDLYRNNSGPAYPYESAGLVSLTGSSAGASEDYYYYLYDWEIKTAPCESPTQEVIANVVETNFSQEIVNNIVYFSDSSNGATSWLWDFGDGSTSTDQHPIHVYSSSGTYDVTLTINDGSCGSNSSLTITEVNDDFDVIIIPNPTTDQANIIFSNPISENFSVEIFSVDGKLIWQQNIENGADQVKIDLRNYSAAVYLISIQSESFSEIRRILKN